MTVSIPHASTVDNDAHQPTSLVALLRELGVTHASFEKQKPVLRAWLATHPTNPNLRISMRCNGYGLLLKEKSAARN